MTRLARGTQQFTRRVGCVRWDYRRPFVRTFSGAENKQKPHVQSLSSHPQPALDPLSYVDCKTRGGAAESLECLPILPSPESEVSARSLKVEMRDAGQRALSPEDEQAFESKFSKIWEWMKTSKKKPEWENIISREGSEMYSRISNHIPAAIKRILISRDPPTPTTLKSIEWSNTTDAGVFILWTEVSGEQESGEKTVYVYVGSASNYPGGLRFRKRHMLSRSAGPHDEALKRKIKDLGLSPKGQFGELFIVPFKKGLAGGVLGVRALSILARLLLMIWLGAVGGELKSSTKHLVPWKPGKIQYIGLATDNPLLTNINKSDDPKRSGKGRVNRRDKRKSEKKSLKQVKD